MARLGHRGTWRSAEGWFGRRRVGLEQTEASSFGDRRRPRSAAELVTDVRHVPMDRVPAHDQLLGDLAVAETDRDELEHLTLASRQQDRRRFPGRTLRLALHCQYRANRPDHAVGIASPREVGGPLQRNKPRAPDPRGHLATEPVRDGAIPTAVDNQGGGLHEWQLVANVVAIHLLEQGRRRVGASRQPLKPRERFLLLTARLTEKDVRQQPRPKAPMRTHRSHDRLARRRRRDRGPIRVGTVEHQPLDPLGKTRRERDRRTSARRASKQTDPLRAELIYQRSHQQDLAIHTQILLAQLTLRHPHSQSVIADHGVPTTDRLPEAREPLIAPIKLQMADPPRRTQQQRPLTGHLISEAATINRQEPDLSDRRHRAPKAMPLDRWPASQSAHQPHTTRPRLGSDRSAVKKPAVGLKPESRLGRLRPCSSPPAGKPWAKGALPALRRTEGALRQITNALAPRVCQNLKTGPVRNPRPHECCSRSASGRTDDAGNLLCIGRRALVAYAP